MQKSLEYFLFKVMYNIITHTGYISQYKNQEKHYLNKCF